MWNIQKTVSKGDYVYAIVPEHPKATKNHYVLLHRVIMENLIGRMLTDEEIVHHKDHNKKNNSIENLQLMERRSHSQMHSREHGRQMATLICPWCKKEFVTERKKTHLIKPSKYHYTCCCRKCRGKLSRYIQLNGVTPSVQEDIDNNIINTFIEYRTI